MRGAWDTRAGTHHQTGDQSRAPGAEFHIWNDRMAWYARMKPRTRQQIRTTAATVVIRRMRVDSDRVVACPLSPASYDRREDSHGGDRFVLLALLAVRDPPSLSLRRLLALTRDEFECHDGDSRSSRRDAYQPYCTISTAANSACTMLDTNSTRANGMKM